MKKIQVRVIKMAVIISSITFINGAASHFTNGEGDARRDPLAEEIRTSPETRPSHGGYSNVETVVICIADLEGRTHRLEFHSTDFVARLREAIIDARMVPDAHFKIMYRDIEVMKDSASKIGDVLGHLVLGDSMHTVELIAHQENQ
jgi:hypothetical protein